MASTTISPAIPSPGIIKLDVFDYIREQGAACHFPTAVVTSARMLCGQVTNPGIFCHSGKKLMAAACLCVAARFAQHLFPLNDLARAAFTDRGAINHLAHHLQAKLGIRRPPADLRVLVPQVCERLGLPEATEGAAYALAQALQARVPMVLQGRAPPAVAAAVIRAAGDATGHHMTFTACAKGAYIAVSAVIAASKALARCEKGNSM